MTPIQSTYLSIEKGVVVAKRKSSNALNSALLLILIGIALPALLSAKKATAQDDSCCSLVARALSSAAAIKPGMKRRDVDKSFVQEVGGISFRIEGRYVFKECPYIKIKIRFSEAHETTDNESPEDIVTGVSTPYLEGSVKD